MRVGLPPGSSSKREAVDELVRFMRDRFGVAIEPVFARDYRSGVEELVDGVIDAAWLSPLGLLRADRQARPIAVLVRAERGSYHGAIAARRDRNLVGIRDLAGLRIGWVDADSAAGYVLTRALIAEQRPDVDGFLGAQSFLGSHAAVVTAILEGAVDAGATFLNFDAKAAIVHSGWQEFLGDRAHELAPIAITEAIPGDVIAIRNNLPNDDRKSLLDVLEKTLADPDGKPLFQTVFNGAVALAKPKPGAHDALAVVARRAGWRP